MLNHYYVDASSLSVEEQERIYSDLQNNCFITRIDLQHPGCYETFIEERYDLKSLVLLPDSCVVTHL